MKLSFKKLVMRFLPLLLCLLMLSAPALAQDVTGTIVGVAKDATGALIPTVKVTATNTGTQAATSATVLSDGSYTLRLTPGTYDVTIDAGGFKSQRVSGVKVEVNSQSRADAVLGAGNAGEVVTVSATNNNVDTTTSTLKEVIGEQTIEDAPLNGRNALTLMLLVPGVTRDPNANVTSGATYPGAFGVSVNGNRSDTTNYILDGSDDNDNYTNAPNPFPNPDALREFSVQTNNFGAEFGRLPGGVVNAITKSGENRIHGSVFEYVRNNYFNAANHFATVVNGVKTDDGLKRHQFGGTFGGPVFLPHLYDGRNKSFFFVSVQETLVHQRPNTNTASVPDAKLRAGDFSELLNNKLITNPCSASGNPLQLYIPYDPGGAPYVNNQITRFNPISTALLRLVPVAPAGTCTNNNGTQQVNFRTVNKNSDYQLFTRVDQKITSKNQLYATFFNSHQQQQPFFDPTNILAIVNAGDWVSRRYQINDVHIFNAHLLNEASFAYAHDRYANTPIYPSASLTSLGLQAYVPPGQNEYDLFIGGYFNIYTGDTNQFIRDEYQGIETVRFTKGKHQVSVGGEYVFGTGDNINNFQQNPIFNFNASAKGSGIATSTGNGFADFLTGRISSFTQGAGEFKNTRYNHFAAFAEDSYKVASRLVLNLGVRYEPFLPYYDLNNKLAVYRPGQQSTLYPNAPSGVLFVGDPGVPHGGFNSGYTNIAPRAGLAYDVFGDGKTSLRVGYGIFFDQPNTITTNNQTDQAPFAPVVNPTGSALNSFSNPYGGLTNPFPYPTPATSASTFPVGSFQFLYSPRMRNDYVQAYNVQVQQDLGFGTIFSIAYAGSAASHLPIARELNAAVFNPNFPAVGSCAAGSNTCNTNQRRLFYPALGSSTLLEASGSSNYNSLQANVRHHFASGLSVLANYTWSKAIDTASDTKTLNPTRTIPSNANYDRGPANFDRRHVLNATTIYQIPFPFRNHVARVFLGGWEHTMIYNFTGGIPFTIGSGRDNAFTGTPSQRASVLQGAPLYLGRRSTANTAKAFFNTAAFFQPGGANVQAYGNTGRNAYRGPNFENVDMGLLKPFPIHEQVNLIFRFEAFNVLNHTDLSIPSTTITAGNFGQITSTQGGSNPRILQFALRVAF